MKIKLRQAFDLQMGKTPARNRPDYWNGDHKWISIADIGNAGKFLTKTKESITAAGIDGSGIKVVPQGTVIMSFKLSIGKTAITSEDMYTNEAIMAFIDNGKFAVDTNYLYHLCCGTNWTAGTNKAVMGLTLNKATLLEKEIPLPDINEQHKIATKLDKIDALIAERQQQLELIDQAVKSRFIELFGDPETNPKGWIRQRLDQVCENLDSRRVPITSTDRKAGNYPYYGASGIVDYVEDYIFDEDILLISEDGANLVMRSTPIAFSVSGKVWVNNHAHVVRFESKATQKYIEICFALTDISGSITGTAQPKLNQAKLNAMMFCVPPIELQEQFAAFVEQTDKSKLCGKMEVAA